MKVCGWWMGNGFSGGSVDGEFEIIFDWEGDGCRWEVDMEVGGRAVDGAMGGEEVRFAGHDGHG